MGSFFIHDLKFYKNKIQVNRKQKIIQKVPIFLIIILLIAAPIIAAIEQSKNGPPRKLL